jgi:hypothetical protein
MNIDLTIKNYRCFSDQQSARIQIHPGFTALVGANNSGKTSLLRFLYEFRWLFQNCSSPNGNFQSALNNGLPSFAWPQTVVDPQDVFHNGNNRVDTTGREQPHQRIV